MVDALCALLGYRRAAKDYHAGTWFHFRGCPPEMPHLANPPELWTFLLEADTVEAAILKESLPGGGE